MLWFNSIAVLFGQQSDSCQEEPAFTTTTFGYRTRGLVGIIDRWDPGISNSLFLLMTGFRTRNVIERE